MENHTETTSNIKLIISSHLSSFAWWYLVPLSKGWNVLSSSSKDTLTSGTVSSVFGLWLTRSCVILSWFSIRWWAVVFCDFLQLHVNRMSILSFEGKKKRPCNLSQKWLFVLTVGNHLHGEMTLHACVCAFFTTILLFLIYFFLTLCLHCSFVSLLCDTVKWFLAFVRHRNVECRVAFTASRGHRLLERDSGLGEEISATAFTLLH